MQTYLSSGINNGIKMPFSSGHWPINPSHNQLTLLVISFSHPTPPINFSSSHIYSFTLSYALFYLLPTSVTYPLHSCPIYPHHVLIKMHIILITSRLNSKSKYISFFYIHIRQCQSKRNKWMRFRRYMYISKYCFRENNQCISGSQ